MSDLILYWEDWMLIPAVLLYGLITGTVFRKIGF